MKYIFCKMISKFIILFKFKLEVIGLENIPKDGPVILAANHTSNYDPILLISILNRNIHFLGKKELFKYWFSRCFFNLMNVIPVDRQSGNVIRPVRKSLSVIHSGNVYGIFPEGTRCKGGEKVKPKKGLGFFSMKTGAPILPISLVGVKKGFRQPVKIIIGSMIEVNNHSNSDYGNISERIMENIHSIKQKYEQVEELGFEEVQEDFNAEPTS